jgi:DNA-binding beta-propeller fold protein YncE
MYRLHLVILLFMTSTLFACKHDALKPSIPPAPADTSNDYPEAVSRIIAGKCATAGCHNAASYENAGGLLLDTWAHLFDGGNNGAVVVPYDIENSSLLYFINTYPDLGTVAIPAMPLDQTPLSRQDYLTIRDWIAAGAPDKNGKVPFASNAETRQKIYITHQGCDLIGVIDAEKKVIMRYIKAGRNLNIETPDNIKVSADGRFAYACFWNGNTIQKIDLLCDSIVAETQSGQAYWKTLHLSPDGNTLLATTWESSTIAVINTGNMQLTQTYNGFNYPESIAANAAFNTYYVTERFGNTICKLTAGGGVQKISINGLPLTTTPTATTPNPYRILMSKDYSKYFISCERTNEVRVFDEQADTLIKAIPVGRMPQEMALSTNSPYLFVTCLNDTLGNGFIGSVYAINYNTYQTQKIEAKFFQPHGLAVDDINGVLYVFSRNQDKTGPKPHHQSPCNGRNGYYNIFSTATLLPFNNRRYEISVDPYSAAIRF